MPVHPVLPHKKEGTAEIYGHSTFEGNERRKDIITGIGMEHIGRKQP